MRRLLHIASAALTSSTWALLLPAFRSTRLYPATRGTFAAATSSSGTGSGYSYTAPVRFPPMRWLVDTIDDTRPHVPHSTGTLSAPLHLHLIVLIHGWMGNPSELGSLQEALEKEIVAASAAVSDDDTTATDVKDPFSNLGYSPSVSLPSSDSDVRRNPLPRHEILVYAAACNDERTGDGVAAGGQRLASEINAWIDHIRSAHRNRQIALGNSTGNTIVRRFSLSLVGNSLGGLYARYALPDIQWHSTSIDCVPLLEPAVFCTTATPHLGVSSPHTYVPLPHWIEHSMEWAARHKHWNDVTLHDLFRIPSSTVVEDLASDPRFVEPLASFRLRIALANAFHTDFQVPCSTAAFLSPIVATNHYVQSNLNIVDTNDTCNDNQNAPSWLGLAVQTERTFRRTDVATATTTGRTTTVSAITNEQLSTAEDGCETPASSLPVSSDDLARRLDSLGWTKLFCDVRPHLPGVILPSWLFSPSPPTLDDKFAPKSDVKQQVVFTSAELWNRFATSSSSSSSQPHRWVLPFGHTLLVANAKNSLYKQLNSAGQPIMDDLAKVLIQQIRLPYR